MNTIIKILAMALLVIGLVGCQSSEVPPTPDSPGGVAGEYSVAVEDLGTWANPSVSLTDIKDQLTVNPVRSEDNLSFTIADTAIWNDYYIFNFQTEEWTSRTLSLSDESMLYKNTNWILDTKSITSEENFFSQEGEYLIAYYSCSKDGSWDCHNGWQVEGFNVTNTNLSKATFMVSGSGFANNYEAHIRPNYTYPGYEHLVIIRGYDKTFTVQSEAFTPKLSGTALMNLLQFEVITINEDNWEEFQYKGMYVTIVQDHQTVGNIFKVYAANTNEEINSLEELYNFSKVTDRSESATFLTGEMKFDLPDTPSAMNQNLRSELYIDNPSNTIESCKDNNNVLYTTGYRDYFGPSAYDVLAGKRIQLNSNFDDKIVGQGETIEIPNREYYTEKFLGINPENNFAVFNVSEVRDFCLHGNRIDFSCPTSSSSQIEPRLSFIQCENECVNGICQ